MLSLNGYKTAVNRIETSYDITLVLNIGCWWAELNIIDTDLGFQNDSTPSCGGYGIPIKANHRQYPKVYGAYSRPAFTGLLD